MALKAKKLFVKVLQFAFLCSSVFPCCVSIITDYSPIKRQGNGPPAPGFLTGDLLPPPALSASFPTLRPRGAPAPPVRPLPQNAPPRPPQNAPPRPPQNPGVVPQPSRELLPPFLAAPNVPRNPAPFQNGPPRPTPPSAVVTTTEALPLLPPIEIPPERPLTDAEILETLPPKESSFIPTTGQGLPTIAKGISIPAAPAPAPTSSAPVTPAPAPAPVQPVAQPAPVEPVARNPVATPAPTVGVFPVLAVAQNSSSSVVRFPTEDEDSASQTTPKICPICECTNEVDYICASSGVLYLNSCSFDCATFCDATLKKVELQLCASHNQIQQIHQQK